MKFILKSERDAITLYYKVLFMTEQSQHLDTIQDIRQLMQKSSRFISLSGLSGIAAGLCALVAAWFTQGELTRYHAAHGWVRANRSAEYDASGGYVLMPGYRQLAQELILIAVVTFGVAFALAFFFTYLRSKKTGVPIWGFTARRVMFSVIVPMIAGGLVILRLIDLGGYGLIAPCCLIFYGLGLISAGRYTFEEIKYLGYGQLVLGALNLWLIGYGLLFWALGFGVLHMVYGFLMWWKHERGERTPAI